MGGEGACGWVRPNRTGGADGTEGEPPDLFLCPAPIPILLDGRQATAGLATRPSAMTAHVKITPPAKGKRCAERNIFHEC
jgi:hypothetical protein